MSPRQKRYIHIFLNFGSTVSGPGLALQSRLESLLRFCKSIRRYRPARAAVKGAAAAATDQVERCGPKSAITFW
jgi:hypothetical protein